MAPKAKTTTQAPEVPATDQAADQLDQLQGAAEELPAGETPATAGAAEDQPAGHTAEQPTAALDVVRVDVRVLASVTIGGARFQPDDVIEGMPDSVAQAYAGSVDPHPDAVAYARSLGAPVLPYPGQAHAED